MKYEISFVEWPATEDNYQPSDVQTISLKATSEDEAVEKFYGTHDGQTSIIAVS